MNNLWFLVVLIATINWLWQNGSNSTKSTEVKKLKLKSHCGNTVAQRVPIVEIVQPNGGCAFECAAVVKMLAYILSVNYDTQRISANIIFVVNTTIPLAAALDRRVFYVHLNGAPTHYLICARFVYEAEV